MRFILKSAIISLVVAATCMLVAAFVAWDFSAFYASNWDPSGRIILLLVSLFFGFGIAEATE